MDDLEFRKQASIDPENQTSDFLEKIKQHPASRRFVSQQQEFNQKLIDTLEFQTPENLADRIILAQQLLQHRSKRQIQQRWLTVGIAAAITGIVLTLYLQFFQTTNSQLLQQQIIQHFHQDTHALDVTMHVPKNHIDTMLASYGGKLTGPIGHVSYLGHCIIGKQTGLHLVLATAQAKVTVIILPSQFIKQTYPLSDGQMSGIIYPSKKGSIAIMSEYPDTIPNTRQHIDRNLNWII